MKTCFKCGEVKPLSDFYRHPMMRDGHLNKCKSCAISDVNKHRITHQEELREYERNRNKTPKRKAIRAECLRRFRQKWPEKDRARQLVNKATRSGNLIKKPCEFSGCSNPQVEAHHEDYSRPLEVRWLCHRHHRQIEGRIAQ